MLTLLVTSYSKSRWQSFVWKKMILTIHKGSLTRNKKTNSSPVTQLTGSKAVLTHTFANPQSSKSRSFSQSLPLYTIERVGLSSVMCTTFIAASVSNHASGFYEVNWYLLHTHLNFIAFLLMLFILVLFKALIGCGSVTIR